VIDAVVGEALVVDLGDGTHDDEPAPLLVVVEATEGLQFYAAPQSSAPQLGKIMAGRSMQIEEQDPTGEWYRVCCVSGKAGWVRVPVAKAAE
jgi:hypothetical protein